MQGWRVVVDRDVNAMCARFKAGEVENETSQGGIGATLGGASNVHQDKFYLIRRPIVTCDQNIVCG